MIPDDIIESHERLQAKRKLSLVLKSKAILEITLVVGDTVEVFQRRGHEKRGSWSVRTPVLSIDHSSRSITVPGKEQQYHTVAIEDVRPATPKHSLFILSKKA